MDYDDNRKRPVGGAKERDGNERDKRYMSRSAEQPRDTGMQDKSDRNIERVDAKLKRIEERREEERHMTLAENAQASTSSNNPAYGQSREKDKVLIREEARSSQFTRYASDPQLNHRLMKESRWDDPARHFLPQLQTPVPKFRAPPNRFDILPGTYWDGIDRSNGFERLLFQKRAGRVALRELEHMYNMEDL